MATYDLTSSIPSKVKTGDILNCPYSGSKKQITLPPGTYKLEVWGAEGGYRSSQSYSGKGGYSVGTITLTDKTVVYLYAGGAGGNSSTNTSAVVTGGFNGGGYRYGYKGGGGGSDVRIRQDSLYARVIVAGGGGSDGAASKNGMYGGGTAGGAASQNYGSHGYGGAQNGNTTSSSTYVATAQGTTNTGDSWYNGFGFGGFGCYANSGYAGAGGGGWYGGCGSYPDSSGDDDRGGGGGSGYIYTSSTAPSYPAGCLLNSSYYLTDASMIAGNASMTSPTGTTETGHYGHGYVRITVIEAQNTERYAKIDPNLPSGYTAVPYLKGTGTQYIDTGFKPTGYTRYVIKMKMNAASNLIGIMGAETGWGSLSFAMWAKHLSYYNSTATNQTWDVSNTTDPVTLDFDKGVLKKNGTTVYSFTTSSFSCAFSAYLFGINRNGTLTEACNGLSIYECEIYNNDVLQRKFIPAKRTSDNVLGMYDTVNSKFYTNAGTGTFETSTETRDNWKKISTAYIKMPYQVPSSYTQLEYITTTGTQYINTNFTPNSNTKIEMETSFSNISSGNYNLWCSRNTISSQTFTCFYIGGSGLRSDYNTTMYSTSKKCAVDEKILATQDKNNFYLNNSLIYTHTAATFNCPYPMLLLASQQSGATSTLGNYHQGKVYYCKIYDNGTLVRNFVPAKRNSDSVAGLYDTVNSVFYTSASSTAFSAGSIASPWIEMKSMHVKMNGSWVEV